MICLNASTSWPTDPPAADELELSIFGSGVGEACVVHLGDGIWLTIDSCKDRTAATVPSLSYLTGMGVSVERDVAYVVASHAHNDHVAGISQIIDDCKSATFICSSALTTREVLAHFISADRATSKQGAVYSEYLQALRILDARRKELGRVPIIYAKEGDVLRLETGPTVVTLLSPSNSSIFTTITAYGQDAAVGGTLRKSSRLDPNDSSVVMQVSRNGSAILLGADLPNGTDGRGWGGVISSGLGRTPLSSLIKVPHHGSPTSDSPDIWSQLMESTPVAVLAPYRAGRRPLPAEEDVRRLRGLTSAVYATAKTHAVTSRGSRSAETDVMSLASVVREKQGQMGLVRARRGTGGSWSISLYGPALQL